MTKVARNRLLTRIIPLCLCLTVFACGDVKCKDMTSSPLRTYGAPERIEKINKEIASLEKNDKDEKSKIRLGDLHEQLASIYFEKEEFDTSLLHINTAFAYKRNTPYLNYIAGLIYGNKGAKSGSKLEIAKAEQYYRQAISLKNDYNEALKALAILLFFYKKEREEPIKIMEGIYERSRFDYHARFTLGRFYYESGRKEDALDVYLALQSDLEKLPKSPIIEEYLLNCTNNIRKIRAEINTSQ
jgi:tetratricopeptide (TPR) repeat protein